MCTTPWRTTSAKASATISAATGLAPPRSLSSGTATFPTKSQRSLGRAGRSLASTVTTTRSVRQVSFRSGLLGAPQVRYCHSGAEVAASLWNAIPEAGHRWEGQCGQLCGVWANCGLPRKGNTQLCELCAGEGQCAGVLAAEAEHACLPAFNLKYTYGLLAVVHSDKGFLGTQKHFATMMERYGRPILCTNLMRKM